MSKFREIQPVKGRRPLKNAAEIIRVYFSYLNEHRSGLVIYIGKQILSRLAIAENARIRFFVDEDNPRYWLITPADDTQGYQLIRASRDCVKCQLTWHIDVPQEWERKTRRVDFQFCPEGVKINAESPVLS